MELRQGRAAHNKGEDQVQLGGSNLDIRRRFRISSTYLLPFRSAGPVGVACSG